MITCPEPDCGGKLRVYRTYPRPAHNNVHHYTRCDNCGQKYKTETTILGPLGQRNKSQPEKPKQYHVNGNSHKWADIQNHLRQGMTQATYDFVIQPMSIIHWHNGEIIIETTQASKDWAEGRLKDIIQRSFESVGAFETITFTERL